MEKLVAVGPGVGDDPGHGHIGSTGVEIERGQQPRKSSAASRMSAGQRSLQLRSAGSVRRRSPPKRSAGGPKKIRAAARSP